MSIFFFKDTPSTEIYTLSLHDALPILSVRFMIGRIASTSSPCESWTTHARLTTAYRTRRARTDRKSTRLNSSHANISYAVFCLKKKKKKRQEDHTTSTVKTSCQISHRR